MPIIEYEKSCTLCGQKVILKSFTLNAPEGLTIFCCSGCLSIYQFLNYKSVPSIKQPSQINKDKIEK
jgi:hypothetical protein